MPKPHNHLEVIYVTHPLSSDTVNMTIHGLEKYHLEDLRKLEEITLKDRSEIRFVDALFTVNLIADTRISENMIEEGLRVVGDYLEKSDDVKAKRIIRGMIPAVNRSGLSAELKSRILIFIACN